MAEILIIQGDKLKEIKEDDKMNFLLAKILIERGHINRLLNIESLSITVQIRDFDKTMKKIIK